MGNDWLEKKQEMREARRRVLSEAENHLPALLEKATSLGLTLEVPGEGHWVVRDRAGRAVAQYWPSASKIQFCRTGRIRKRVDTESLSVILEKL